MVDTIYNVLDQDVDATTGVVREIASLFESEGDKDKRGAVLEALNGFRIEVISFISFQMVIDGSNGSSSQR